MGQAGGDVENANRPMPCGVSAMTSPPRSVEEWAKACYNPDGNWGDNLSCTGTDARRTMCLDCARAYAAEQVAQARGEELEVCIKIDKTNKRWDGLGEGAAIL